MKCPLQVKYQNSEQMHNGKDLAMLQNYIVELMEEQCANSILEFAAPIVAPNAYDVVITDISTRDLLRITDEPNAPALSPSTSAAFPVNGILYRPGVRIFVPLTVSKRNCSVNVNFSLDTGSPNTHLRTQTFAALGFVEAVPGRGECSHSRHIVDRVLVD